MYSTNESLHLQWSGVPRFGPLSRYFPAASETILVSANGGSKHKVGFVHWAPTCLLFVYI